MQNCLLFNFSFQNWTQGVKSKKKEILLLIQNLVFYAFSKDA